MMEIWNHKLLPLMDKTWPRSCYGKSISNNMWNKNMVSWIVHHVALQLVFVVIPIIARLQPSTIKKKTKERFPTMTSDVNVFNGGPRVPLHSRTSPCSAWLSLLPPSPDTKSAISQRPVLGLLSGVCHSHLETTPQKLEKHYFHQRTCYLSIFRAWFSHLTFGACGGPPFWGWQKLNNWSEALPVWDHQSSKNSGQGSRSLWVFADVLIQKRNGQVTHVCFVGW